MLKSAPKLGYTLAIAGGVLSSFSAACAQHLFNTSTVTTTWVIPCRLILAGPIILCIARISRAEVFRIWKEKNLRDILTMLFYALAGVATSQLTFFGAIQYANVAFSTVMCYICPIFVLLWTMLRQRRGPRLYEVLAVLCVVVGVTACATHFDLTKLAVSPVALAMGLGCALTATIYTVAPLRVMEKYGTTPIMGWGMLIGGIVMSLIFRPWRVSVTPNAGLFLDMGVIVICGTILAFFFYTRGVQMVGAVAGNVLSAVEPVVAVLISVAFFHIAFTPADFIGFTLILITVPIIALGQVREKKENQRKLAEVWAKQEAAPEGQSKSSQSK